jgi:ribosomal protein L7/L12
MSSELLWSDIQPVLSQIGKRLDAIEQQLDVVSRHVGVPYERPLAQIPQEIVDLARAGKTLEAIKEYRALTNADLETAKSVVMSL